MTKELFEVNVLEEDKENFPAVNKYEPLEKLTKNCLEWITPTVIEYYFFERMATKGHEKGRKLFMCDF